MHTLGTVYKAHDISSSTRLVAIKLEAYNAQYKSIQFEAGVYKRMGIKTRLGWVPPMLWWGEVSGTQTCAKTPLYRALVLPLLGPSLQTLWNDAGMRLSFCTIMRLADQMVGRYVLSITQTNMFWQIQALEWVHDQRIMLVKIKWCSESLLTG